MATLIAGLSYMVFALLSDRIIGGSRAVSLNPAAPPALRPDTGAWPMRLSLTLLSIALPFLVWWAFLLALNVPSMLGRTPLDVVDYLFLGDTSATAQSRLLTALGETLPITLLGMVLGMGFAFLLAVSSRLTPGFTRAFMPVALITQTMPLVALTPLLVLMLGRGPSLTIWVTISVTFFPAYVMMAHGLALVPRAALEVPRAYGAKAWAELRLVAIPASIPYVFAAMRLTAPRALLGVMIAEWLATGRGLGNLLNQSRGYLDFNMIWTVAAVSVLISVGFHQVVLMVERRVLARMGMAAAE